MDFPVWRAWPWISLIVFFLLVKGLFFLTRGRGLVMYTTGQEERPGPDGLIWLFLASLVIGAAACVLIERFLEGN